MINSLPFDAPSVSASRAKENGFAPPDLSRKAFEKVITNSLPFSNETGNDEYSETIAELMSQADFLDELDRAEDVETDIEDDDISDIPQQTASSDSVPDTQQKSPASPPPLPEFEIEPPPDLTFPAEAIGSAGMTTPSVPSLPGELQPSAAGSAAISSQLHAQIEKAFSQVQSDSGEPRRLASDAIATKVINGHL